MRILDCMLALTLGIWLAMISFGGLWLTLKQASRMGNPKALVIASFLGRAGGVAYCFYHVGQNGGWERLAACVCGFVFIRMVLGRLFERRPLGHATTQERL